MSLDRVASAGLLVSLWRILDAAWARFSPARPRGRTPPYVLGIAADDDQYRGGSSTRRRIEADGHARRAARWAPSESSSHS